MSAIKLKSADGYDVSISATGATTGGATSVQLPGLIKSDTAKTASGTSVDFTGIPAWVRRITVMFDALSSNGANNFLVQLGDSGGIENSGYTFSTAYTGSSSGALASSGAGFIIPTGAANATVDGRLTLHRLTSVKWVGDLNVTSTVGAAIYGCIGGGTKSLTTELTQLRITTVGGTDTFDAGTINILYE